MVCFWLLLLLWGSTCLANFTNSTLGSSLIRRDGQWYYFGWVPGPDSNGQEPLTLQHSQAAVTAYYEAVYLADVAYQSINVDDPIFLRYFEHWDFDFIKGIFGSISGALDGNAAFGSPDIQKAYMCDGSCATDPGVCDPNTNPELPGIVTAVVKQNDFYPKEIINLPGLPPETATISLCDHFFTYHLLAERQCSDILGDNDNILMSSRGSILLHELTHWRTLNVKAPDFEFHVQLKKNLNNLNDWFVGDSHWATPANGYGPLSSHQLVGHANGDATINSDNYQWYALSKFWQLRCPEKNNGQGWGTAVDNDRPGPPVASEDQPGRCPDEYDVPFVDAEIPAEPAPEQ